MNELSKCKLSGRTTVVVGASRGLGRGIARAFAEAGAPVVAVARTGPALAELATTSVNIRTEVADAADATVAWSLLDQYEPEVLILVAGATMNVIQGNFIGTSPDGTTARGNEFGGISLGGIWAVNGAASRKSSAAKLKSIRIIFMVSESSVRWGACCRRGARSIRRAGMTPDRRLSRTGSGSELGYERINTASGMPPDRRQSRAG